MKLKIISDGTVFGSKLIDQDSGQLIKNAKVVRITIDSNSNFVTCEVILIKVPVEIENIEFNYPTELQ
jgi:hypothetical protein